MHSKRGSRLGKVEPKVLSNALNFLERVWAMVIRKRFHFPPGRILRFALWAQTIVSLYSIPRFR